jgi:NADH-quinone oxidoreductase subunit N
MLMALATFTRTGREAVLFYLPVYLVMNLGAFAVVALVRTHTGSETLEACRGLLTRSPALGIVLTIFVMSLLGVPPLAGFLGKFLIFAAVYDAGQFWSAQGIPGIHTGFAVLLGVAVLNTALSAGYYLKVLRSAGLDDPPAGAGPLGESWGAVVWLGSLAGAVVGLGLWWGGLVRLASEAAPGG